MCSITFSRPDSTRVDHSRNNRVESASSNTNPATGDISVKRRKKYVDCSKSELETCLIHDPGNYSDGCKVLGDFGDKYAKVKPNWVHINHTK